MSVLFSLLALSPFYAPVEDQQVAPDFATVLVRIEESRSKLRSAKVEETSTLMETGDRPVKLRKEVKYNRTYQFDYDTHRYRLDEMQEWNFIEGPGFDKLKPRVLGGIHILTPDQRIDKPLDARRVQISVGNGLPQMLDLRLIGFIAPDDMERPTSFTEFFEQLKGIADSTVYRKATSMDGESVILRMERDIGGFIVARRVWVDPRQDWVPLRFLEERLVKTLDGTKLLAVQAETNVTWQEMAGAVVPVSFLGRNNVINSEDNSVSVSRELSTSLSWTRVNDTLDDSAFLLSSIDNPPGSHVIVDTTSGTPIRVQDPAVPDARQLKALVTAAPASAPALSRNALLLIIAQVIVVVALAAGVKRLYYSRSA